MVHNGAPLGRSYGATVRVEPRDSWAGSLLASLSPCFFIAGSVYC